MVHPCVPSGYGNREIEIIGYFKCNADVINTCNRRSIEHDPPVTVMGSVVGRRDTVYGYQNNTVDGNNRYPEKNPRARIPNSLR